MTWLHLLAALGTGLGLGLGLVPCLLRNPFLRGCRRQAEFHHDTRKLVPRVGGLALLGAFLAMDLGLSIFLPAHHLALPGRWAVLAGSVAMFALGFWDDLKPIGARHKLALQMAIAFGAWCSGVGIERFRIPWGPELLLPAAWSCLLTVAWLVVLPNLINLVDGVDGLAASIGLMLMGLLVCVGHQGHTYVFLAAGMAGALLAFLWFNFPPARIYLGDGGAYLVGFLAAMLSLIGSHKGTMVSALVGPLFVLVLPLADATLAVARRGLRGLPLMRPDRRHLHHHLLEEGLNNRQVVLYCGGVTLAFLGLALLVCYWRGQYVAVLAGSGLAGLLVCARRFRFSRDWFALRPVVVRCLAMRPQVRYGVALTETMAQRCRGCRSPEQLTAELVGVAERLGFTACRVLLPEGEKIWQQAGSCSRRRWYRQEYGHGRSWALELGAPCCLGAEPRACSGTSLDAAAGENCGKRADPRLFEILSELVAEAWGKTSLGHRKPNLLK